jgi:uncharacterized protein YqgC (DUF456 family)
MSKAIYFGSLVIAVGFVVAADGELFPRAWIIPLALGLLAVGLLWRRYVSGEARERTFRRTYGASSDATYGALCGTLAELGYAITTRELGVHAVDFRGGNLGPWIGRYGVSARASVHQTAPLASEIVIDGHLSVAEKDGLGVLVYPDGLGLRASEIFDRVQRSVVTYAMTDGSTHIADNT